MSKHFADVVLVGELLETPAITEIPPDRRPYCKVPVSVRGHGEFPLVVKGRVTESLLGKAEAGDIVTVKGRLHQEMWTTDMGKERDRTVIVARHIVVHGRVIPRDVA